MNAGWNHLAEDAIATNNDPCFGGIVDKAIVSGEWFVIPNSEHIPVAEGFKTKDDALRHLQAEVERVYWLA